MVEKLIIVLFLVVSTTYLSNAQNVNGLLIDATNTATRDASAAFEINANTNTPGSPLYGGLLPPRVALTGTTDVTTISGTEANGLTVFNTATAGDVTPGYYYWSGSAWVRMLSGTLPSTKWNAITDPDGALTLNHGTHASTFNFTNSTTTGWTLNHNSLTTGTGLSLSSNGIIASGGELLNIAANNATIGSAMRIQANGLTSGSALEITSAGTAASNAIRLISLQSSGANAAANGVSYGIQSMVTNTGTTLSNTAGQFIATSTSAAATNRGVEARVGGTTTGSTNLAVTASVPSNGPVTNTAGTTTYTGLQVSGGAITQNGGTTFWKGAFINMPNITQTSGTLQTIGLHIGGGTVASGTTYAITTEAGAGNVGIGETAPTARLHLDIGDATAVNQKFTAGTTTGVAATDGFDIGIDASGNAEIRQRENLPINFFANNTNHMVLASNGILSILPTNQNNLVAASSIRIGNTTATAATAGAGAIRYNSNDLEFSDGTNWIAVNSSNNSATTRWDQLLAPTANLSLAHANFTTAFTFNTLTGANASAFSMSSSSTAGTASSASTILNLARSGANANATHTAYGIQSAVTNTGATSTNVAGYFSASGATNNYALVVPSTGGNVGVGLTTPTAKMSITSNGTELGGTAMSATFKTHAGTLGGTATNEIAAGSIGFTANTNRVALGVRGYRVSAGSDWTTSAIILGMDVDATVRAGGYISIGANGVIGIGVVPTSNTYKLNVQGGKLLTAGIDENSDARLKKDVNPIEEALQKVNQMRGVTYNWRTEEFPERNFEKDMQFGLIAQELEKVIPELVTTDDDGYKAIEYSHLVPVLIEAIKELDAKNNEQKVQLDKQSKTNEELKASIENLLIRMNAMENNVEVKTNKAEK